MEVRKKSTNLFKEIFCANDECLVSFIPKTYNGIYCSSECRKVVTNRKLLEKYYTDKSNKTKKRICITEDCVTILSRYNKEKICERCKTERYIARLVSWGWDEEKIRKEML
jgi:uncharacterized paraquat-inducible protein A